MRANVNHALKNINKANRDLVAAFGILVLAALNNTRAVAQLNAALAQEERVNGPIVEGTIVEENTQSSSKRPTSSK